MVEDYLNTRRPFVGIASFAFMRKHLEVALGGEVKMVNSDGYNLDTCFFKWDDNVPGSNERRVTIICNPNAGRYEHTVWNPHWVTFHRGRGNALLLWNYRGYGRSEGEPSPNNLRKDIESLVRYLQEEKGCKRFAFHGESIGGIPACHAMVNCENNVDGLLICDRTFSSLHRVASSIAGNLMARLMYLFTGWLADSDVNFLIGASTSNRLILQDPDDAIVHHEASLKIGVASRLVNRLEEFTLEQIESFYNDFTYILTSVERLRGAGVEDANSLRKMCRYFLNIDGGHGDRLEAALQREKHKRHLSEAFATSKLGRAQRTMERLLRKLGLCRSTVPKLEQNHMFDWFACTFVFGNAQDNAKRFSQLLPLIDDVSAGISEPLQQALGRFREFIERFSQTIEKSNARDGEWLEKSKYLLRGALITLRCGHNGSLTTEDFTQLHLFLEQGRFVGATTSAQNRDDVPAQI